MHRTPAVAVPQPQRSGDRRATHQPLDAWLHPAPGLLARLLQRYTEGWKWYAARGYAPPAAEPGFPYRRIATATPAPRRMPRCTELMAACTPRFALLFPHAATGPR